MSLPSGYTQLTYVQSNGAQYINTGITGKSGLNVVCDVEFTDVAAVQAIFGAQYNNGQRYSVNCNTSKFEFQFWSTYTTTNVGITANQRYSVEANFAYRNGYLNVDGVQATTADGNNGTSTYAWFLFARHNGANVDRYAYMKLYSMTIKDGSTVVRNFIPCKNASNVVGMYDDVNGVFYSSATSTPLIAGNPVLPVPDTPTNFRATDVQKTTVSLAWNAVAADGYKVRRGGTLVYTGTANSYTATGLTEDTQYTFTVTAYNSAGESDAASISVRTVSSAAPPTPTNLQGTFDGETVHLSWSASSGASGYRIKRNGVQIAEQTALTFADADIQPFNSYVYSVYAYNGDGASDPATVAVQTPSPQPLLWLIFDRTAADVELVKRFNAKGFAAMTAAEKSLYMSSLKGAYNASDLNRVGAAVKYVADRLNSLGGFNISYTAKTDWTIEDIPTPAQMEAYIADIAAIRAAYAVIAPSAPTDAEMLTYTEANNIETILLAADEMLKRVVQTFVYSGQVYSGVIWGNFT